MTDKLEYQRRTLFAVMIQKPSGLSEQAELILKEMLEKDAVQITGLHNDFRMAVPSDPNRIHQVPFVVYETVNPAFDLVELHNRAVEKFVYEELTKCGEFSVMFIEPNMNYTEAQAVWLCTGMRLASFKGIVGIRDLESRFIDGATLVGSHRVRITFSTTKVGRGENEKQMAKEILKQLTGDPAKMKTPVNIPK